MSATRRLRPKGAYQGEHFRRFRGGGHRSQRLLHLPVRHPSQRTSTTATTTTTTTHTHTTTGRLGGCGGRSARSLQLEQLGTAPPSLTLLAPSLPGGGGRTVLLQLLSAQWHHTTPHHTTAHHTTHHSTPDHTTHHHTTPHHSTAHHKTHHTTPHHTTTAHHTTHHTTPHRITPRHTTSHTPRHSNMINAMFPFIPPASYAALAVLRQCSAVECSAVQRSAVEWSGVEWSAVECIAECSATHGGAPLTWSSLRL